MELNEFICFNSVKQLTSPLVPTTIDLRYQVASADLELVSGRKFNPDSFRIACGG